MAQGILFDQSQLLEVKFDGEYCQINYGFHTFQEFHKDDLATLRVSVVQLVSMGVKKSKLSNIFNTHHKTIERWEKIYKEKGVVGLVNMKNGRPLKCDDTIERYIVDLAEKLQNQNGYKKIIIDEVNKLFKQSISRELIRQILNKNVRINKKAEGKNEVTDGSSELKKKDK